MEINLIIEKWYEWLKFIRSFSPHTLESYTRDMREFISFLSAHVGGEVNVGTLKKLSIPELRSWFSSRYSRGVSAKSNNRALSVIRNFFRYIKNNYEIENEAVFLLSRPIQRRTLPKALSIPDIKTLVEKMELSDLGEPWVVKREIAIVVLLYGAGLRISEALNLRVSDLGRENLIIKGKGDKQRQVLILPVVKNCIQVYVKACPHLGINNKTEYLFLGFRGKKLGRTYVANRLQKIRRMLDLPEILSPHAFRHSFATHLLQEDVDISSIQRLLGHSSLDTTQIYTHLNDKDVFNMYKNFQKGLKQKLKS